MSIEIDGKAVAADMFRRMSTGEKLAIPADHGEYVYIQKVGSAYVFSRSDIKDKVRLDYVKAKTAILNMFDSGALYAKVKNEA